MSAAAIRALIWKEWREQRLALTLRALLIIGWSITLVIICGHNIQLAGVLIILSLTVMPLIIAAISGVLSFATETVHGRWMFLSSRALAVGNAFGIKYLFGFLSSVLLCLISWSTIITLMPDQHIPDGWSAYLNIVWIGGYLFLVAFIYASTVMSIMLAGRAIIALMLAPFIIVFTIILTILALIAVIPFMLSYKALFCIYMLMLALSLTMSGATLWKRDISKGSGKGRTLLTLAGVIIIVSILLHTVSTVYTSLKLKNAVAEARAEGLKLSIAEIIPSPVPEAENAAVLYNEAFALQSKLYSRYKQTWRKYHQYPGETMPNKLKVMQIEDKDAIKLFNLLEKAVAMKKCRFADDYWLGLFRNDRVTDNVWHVSRFLGKRTLALIEEGRKDEALKTVEVGLKLGASMDNHPSISNIYCGYIKASICNSIIPRHGKTGMLSGFIVDMDDFHRISSIVKRRGNDVASILKNEIAIGNDLCFGELSTYIYNRGNRLGFNSYRLRDGPGILMAIYYTYPLRPILLNDNASFLQLGMQLLKLSNQPFYKARNAIENLNEKLDNNLHNGNVLRCPFTIIGGTYILNSNIYQEAAEYESVLESLRVGMALKAYRHSYGNYPMTLDTLTPDILPYLPTDPLTGESYYYHRQDQGFILYGLGPNLRDERRKYGKDNPCDDIVWRSVD
ncbi:MAG: hypothetical protein PHT33_02475 [bacterium]|nr:hypothetical protein [bacterium]